MTRGKGEGTIYQDAKGLWTTAVELPPGVRPNGKPLRRRKVIRSRDKAVVMRKLAELRKEVDRSGDMPTASMTTEDWLTHWLDNVAAPRLRPNVYATYGSQIRKQIIPAIGKTRLDKLTAAHVRRVHSHIIDAGLSSSYALGAHRILSKALTDAEREGKVTRNVAKLTDAPRREPTKLHALDVEEAIAVIGRVVTALDASAYDPEPARWATYLLTGLRRGELLGLEWDRIDFDENAIDLSWQLQRISDIDKARRDYEYRPLEGGLYLTRPKTNAGWRVIPLVDPLRAMLLAHREHTAATTHGLVFTRPDGRPIEPRYESERWPDALAEMNVTDKKVRLHDLRHTTVDLLYEAGVPEDIIMEIVGHSVRMVTRGYKSRGNQKRLTDAMLQLSALVSPA